LQWGGIDTIRRVTAGDIDLTPGSGRPVNVNGNLIVAGAQYISAKGNWLNWSDINALTVDAGNVLYLGNNAASIQLQQDTTVKAGAGMVYAKNVVRAAAMINGSTGAITQGFGFSSGTRLGVGIYRLTLAAAVSHPLVVANPYGTAGGNCSVNAIDATTFDLYAYLFSGGVMNPTDLWIYVIVASA
jgi:hypothetical protein